jgi:hypothetical protein
MLASEKKVFSMELFNVRPFFLLTPKRVFMCNAYTHHPGLIGVTQERLATSS